MFKAHVLLATGTGRLINTSLQNQIHGEYGHKLFTVKAPMHRTLTKLRPPSPNGLITTSTSKCVIKLIFMSLTCTSYMPHMYFFQCPNLLMNVL